MFDLAIHGKFYADGMRTGWVYIKQGKIAKVSSVRLERAEAEFTLSASQFLLPAATDLHVHPRDWSQAKKETVETGTKSAIAGGVTTVAEMPNTDPKLDSVEVVERRVELMRAKSFADFAIHAGAPASPEGIRALRMAGAFALKLYPPDLVRFPRDAEGCLKSEDEGGSPRRGPIPARHWRSSVRRGRRDKEDSTASHSVFGSEVCPRLDF